MLPKMTHMRLDQQAKPFDHPEWLFEVKFDGFRALAYMDGQCELVSRKGITYKRFQNLRDQMKLEHSAILDGEIVCLDGQADPRYIVRIDWLRLTGMCTTGTLYHHHRYS